jgi:hypothetical protein
MTRDDQPNTHGNTSPGGPPKGTPNATRDEMSRASLCAKVSNADVSDAVLAYFAHTPGALESHAPPRDLWPTIESRLRTGTVIPLHSRRTRAIPQWTRLLVAATLLVVATAGVTYRETMRRVDTQRAVATAANGTTTPTMGASSTATPSNTVPNDFTSGIPASHSSIPVVQVGNRGRGTQNGNPDVYEQEIASLQSVLNDKRSELKPETVETIEQNLKVIDEAIRQSREALANDPASRFLLRQLDRACAKKIELLRTAALLPASA